MQSPADNMGTRTWLIFAICLTAYAVGTEGQAVPTGVHLNKTALFKDAQGGLTNATDLSSYLPSHSFTLGNAGSANASGLCYAHGATDECAKVNSTWSIRNATYSDASDASVPWNTNVTVCICQGAPYNATSLASQYSKVYLAKIPAIFCLHKPQL